MKGIALYILILTACLGSCTTDKDLDKLPPAYERTAEALSSVDTKLESHKAYWRLVYYPDNQRSYGGYTMYVHFEDGQVIAFSETSETADTSLYRIENLDMPVLSFDTRNTVLHHFSTATEYFRNARGGDFELLLMGSSADTILLQGRKHRNKMRLEPMTNDPSEELTAITNMRLALQGKGIQPLNIGSAGEVQLVLHPTYRQLEFIQAASGEEASQKSTQMAFAYTPEGLTFYEPVTIGGITISKLVLNETKTELRDPDNNLSFKLTEPPLDFYQKGYVLEMNTTHASAPFISALRTANRATRREKDASLSGSLYFGHNSSSDIRAGLVGNDSQSASFITFRGQETGQTSWFRLAYEVDFVGLGSATDQIRIIPLDGNEATYWYWYDTEVKPVINTFRRHSPYKVERQTSAVKETYRLTSVQDSQYWFDLAVR